MPDSSETPVLNELKERIDRIKALLDDPHPGLFTWNTALHVQMRELNKWWNES